jgi:hypothetical protein
MKRERVNKKEKNIFTWTTRHTETWHDVRDWKLFIRQSYSVWPLKRKIKKEGNSRDDTKMIYSEQKMREKEKKASIHLLCGIAADVFIS